MQQKITYYYTYYSIIGAEITILWDAQIKTTSLYRQTDHNMSDVLKCGLQIFCTVEVPHYCTVRQVRVASKMTVESLFCINIVYMKLGSCL